VWGHPIENRTLGCEGRRHGFRIAPVEGVDVLVHDRNRII
jgi:hypothetical protein